MIVIFNRCQAKIFSSGIFVRSSSRGRYAAINYDSRRHCANRVQTEWIEEEFMAASSHSDSSSIGH